MSFRGDAEVLVDSEIVLMETKCSIGRRIFTTVFICSRNCESAILWLEASGEVLMELRTENA
jgi:hypothetical protein